MRYAKAALAAVLSGCLFGGTALAQNNAVKIGVLDDMSGPYAENTGPGDVLAAKFAIADFGGSVLGKPIELVSADFRARWMSVSASPSAGTTTRMSTWSSASRTRRSRSPW